MGISIAVGTVLGASTLPFYSQPGTQLINLAYGASAGAVTGLGVLVYGLFQGSSPDPYEAANYQPSSPISASLQAQTVLRPPKYWMPLVSVNW